MASQNPNNSLFENELEILSLAKDIMTDESFRQNELLGHYESIVQSYEKLLKLTNKVFKISDVQGKELKRRESELKAILDNSNQGFLTFGRSLLVNKEYSAECTKIFNKKIVGANILDLLSIEGKTQKDLFISVLNKLFKIKKPDQQRSLLNELPTMLKINDNYVNIKYKLISDDESGCNEDTVMLLLTDITEKRKTEDQVLYLSYHDKLTSLYNRAYVDSIIYQLQSDNYLPLSIVMADMNGLKLTNDVFGHESGDKLLVAAADVLKSCCRKNDIIARWGGDEFLILLPNTERDVCLKVCDRIRDACGNVSPTPIKLSISLGSATTADPSTNLSELFSVAENIMYTSKLSESRMVRREILLSLENVLHKKDYDDHHHINRIRKMSSKFATMLEIDDSSVEMSNINLLASFHDIGKIAIPKEILHKTCPLTESEWEIMKSHTEIGFRLAQSIEEPILAQAILSLREHWDGRGYPYGLKHEQIPLLSRLVAIIDAFDVMTNGRPYKSAISKESAIKELETCKGTQFDPHLTDLFLSHIDEITNL